MSMTTDGGVRYHAKLAQAWLTDEQAQALIEEHIALHGVPAPFPAGLSTVPWDGASLLESDRAARRYRLAAADQRRSR